MLLCAVSDTVSLRVSRFPFTKTVLTVGGSRFLRVGLVYFSFFLLCSRICLSNRRRPQRADNYVKNQTALSVPGSNFHVPLVIRKVYNYIMSVRCVHLNCDRNVKQDGTFKAIATINSIASADN